MINKKRILTLGISLASVLVILYLIRRPVFLRAPSFYSVLGQPGFVLFNPFRDKEPEKSADGFLNGLKVGDCFGVVKNLPAEQQSHICEKQKQYPLKAWRLKDRDDIDQKTVLFYWHFSGDSYEPERLWLDSQLRDGKWEITDMRIVY